MTSSVAVAVMWAAANHSTTHNHGTTSSTATAVTQAAANCGTTCNHPTAT